MDDIIAEARALGKKIAGHPRMKNFVTAARAVAQNREAQDVLKRYQDQAQKVQMLEMNGKPIEPDDKRLLADLQGKVASNELLKNMLRYQADYLEMMKRINDAIDSAADEAEDA